MSCQGESDVSETDYLEYKRLFKKVHEYLKSNLGITRGALVPTGYPITYYYDKVLLMNKAQSQLIEENDDIISGSSYMYEYYIPDQTTYESSNYINNRYLDESGNKMSFEEAAYAALTSVCVFEDDVSNFEHYTSAALTQVGRETALAFTEVEEISIISNPTKTKYIQNYEELNLDGGKLSVKLYNGTVKEIDMTDSMVEIKGFDNTEIGTNTISLTVEGKTIKFDVNIIPKSLESISVNKLPTKVQYVQKYEEIDLTGGILELKYDDETSEKIYMTSRDVEVTGFDNTSLGEKQVTITYKEKTTTFKIKIVEKELESIEIKKLPVKINYIQNYKNEQLDLTGGIITLNYNAGPTEEIDMTSDDVEVTGFDNTKLGKRQLTVKYEGKTTTFSIDIVEKSLTNIEIKQLPKKLQYIKGYEQLDLKEGIILLKYNDQTIEEIDMTSDDIEVTGFDNTKLGKKQIALTYKEKKVTFTVEIVEKDVIEIKVKELPKQLEYIQSYEELDLTGGKILVIYDNETKEEIEMSSKNVEVTGFDNSQIGKQAITLNYGGKSATFTVQIIKKSVIKIEIKNKPSKLEYIIGDKELELDGVTILVTYNDKTTKEMDMNNTNVEVTGFNSTKLGKQTIKVKYAEKEDAFEIEVVEREIINDNNDNIDNTDNNNNANNSSNNSTNNNSNNNTDNTISKNELPSAGNKAEVGICIGIVIGLAIFFKRRYNKIQIK